MRCSHLEKKIPGSMALSAGSCRLCKECTRMTDEKCRNPERARCSIEAIGGDVGKTISRLMGIELGVDEREYTSGKSSFWFADCSGKGRLNHEI